MEEKQINNLRKLAQSAVDLALDHWLPIPETKEKDVRSNTTEVQQPTPEPNNSGIQSRQEHP